MGRVILYADRITGSMDRAIKETDRRRRKQVAYNKKHGIVPRTIVKTLEEILQATSVADSRMDQDEGPEEVFESDSYEDMLVRIEAEMVAAARDLEFEKAASLRDRMEDIVAMIAMSGKPPRRAKKRSRKGRR